MTGYGFHPEALRDLDQIWEFIAVDNLDAADRVIDEIITRVEGLVSFSSQGHKRPDLTSLPLRFTVVRDYLIAYASGETPMWVVAVVHGRRSPRVIAAILRDRSDP
jgi:toxin ParE1/3/4